MESTDHLFGRLWESGAPRGGEARPAIVLGGLQVARSSAREVFRYFTTRGECTGLYWWDICQFLFLNSKNCRAGIP